MKRRSVAIVIPVALVIVITAWLYSPSRAFVRDVRRPESLNLRTKPTIIGSNVWALTIQCSGYIDGDATISLMLDGQAYKNRKIGGNVDFAWRGDWYADTAEVHYEPIAVISGTLALRYTFHRLP